MFQITKSLFLALFVTAIFGNAVLAQTIKPVDQPTTTSSYHYRDTLSAKGAPILQGATMGTIGPQGTDATYVTGIMTAGTVRVNNLANLEAALNITADLALIVGHIVGIWYLIKTFRSTVKTPGFVLGGVAKGLTFISVGMLSPAFVSWAIASTRDACLFH